MWFYLFHVPKFYNLYQIQYFEHNKAINEEWFIADSMKNACSDLIQLFFELSFIGLSLILAILYIFIKKNNQSTNINSPNYGIYVSFLGIIVCACFS